jgi:hypothetical protein
MGDGLKESYYNIFLIPDCISIRTVIPDFPPYLGV